MKRYNIFLLLLCFIIVSCQEDTFYTQGFDDPNIPDCIDCGPDTPLPTGDDDDPDPPTPPSVDRYKLGKDTGIKDADEIFHSYYDLHNKYDRICGGTGAPDKIDKWTPDYPPYDVCQEDITCNYDYSKIKVCYTESYSGANANLSQFIISYRNNIQNKINNLQDVDFNRGLLYGFNYQLLRYSVNYGISMP